MALCKGCTRISHYKKTEDNVPDTHEVEPVTEEARPPETNVEEKFE